MCKHVAAVLYGVGARLDQAPELLFMLRKVDETELLAGAGGDLSFTKATPRAKVLDDGDVAALFGLEMAEPRTPEKPKAIARARPKPPPAASAPTVKPVADKKTANKATASKKAANKKARKRENRQPERGKERRTGRSGRCRSRRSVGAPRRVNRGFLNSCRRALAPRPVAGCGHCTISPVR